MMTGLLPLLQLLPRPLLQLLPRQLLRPLRQAWPRQMPQVPWPQELRRRERLCRSTSSRRCGARSKRWRRRRHAVCASIRGARSIRSSRPRTAPQRSQRRRRGLRSRASRSRHHPAQHNPRNPSLRHPRLSPPRLRRWSRHCPPKSLSSLSPTTSRDAVFHAPIEIGRATAGFRAALPCRCAARPTATRRKGPRRWTRNPMPRD